MTGLGTAAMLTESIVMDENVKMPPMEMGAVPDDPNVVTAGRVEHRIHMMLRTMEHAESADTHATSPPAPPVVNEPPVSEKDDVPVDWPPLPEKAEDAILRAMTLMVLLEDAGLHTTVGYMTLMVASRREALDSDTRAAVRLRLELVPTKPIVTKESDITSFSGAKRLTTATAGPVVLDVTVTMLLCTTREPREDEPEKENAA